MDMVMADRAAMADTTEVMADMVGTADTAMAATTTTI